MRLQTLWRTVAGICKLLGLHSLLDKGMMWLQLLLVTDRDSLELRKLLR